MFIVSLSASMSFSEASECFLQSRTAPTTAGRVQYISKRTFRDNGYYLKTLGTFFGGMRLDQIHIGHISEYQRMRAEGDGFTRVIGNKKGGERIASPAGAVKINSEVGLLKKMMTEAGAWTPELTKCYRRFQVPDLDLDPALSRDQQEFFLTVASSNPEWHAVWWYAIVAFHTTFSSDEMRTIRIGDINLTHQIIGVNRRYGKNRFRRRDIPICDAECSWAIERLIERARELAGDRPHHHLFPFRVRKNVYDPERPMGETGLRKAFDACRKAAQLDWFKWNGMRHTAITRLAEEGVPMAIIMRRAGHMTSKMSEHYTHISEQAERIEIKRATERKPVVSIDAERARRKMFG